MTTRKYERGDLMQTTPFSTRSRDRREGQIAQTEWRRRTDDLFHFLPAHVGGVQAKPNSFVKPR
jgi:hypothetical protein